MGEERIGEQTESGQNPAQPSASELKSQVVPFRVGEEWTVEASTPLQSIALLCSHVAA